MPYAFIFTAYGLKVEHTSGSEAHIIAKSFLYNSLQDFELHLSHQPYFYTSVRISRYIQHRIFLFKQSEIFHKEIRVHPFRAYDRVEHERLYR